MRAAPLFAALLLLMACSRRPAPPAVPPSSVGSIVRLDPAFDALVPPSTLIEKLAGGFQFAEGPLWRPDGALWFSDVAGNLVLEWKPNGSFAEILRQGGGENKAAPRGSFIGPNGMVADRDGGVLVCQHSNRDIARISRDRRVTVVVDKFEGKRFNSPNDLVFRSDGSLYFTDPPYGLLKQDDDPAKQLKFNGVFRLAGAKLRPVILDLTRPNGIAFSQDDKTLYVANSDAARKVWMRYDVMGDGTVKNGRVFADVTAESAAGLPDGMKVDERGNLYCTGPGGIWVFSADARHLGTIKLPEIPANCNWGDDGKSLYITAQTGLYRIRLAVAGKKALFR